jgi:hypothetical protein
MNLIGILIMCIALRRARQSLNPFMVPS